VDAASPPPVSPVSLLIDQLAALSGDDAMPRLLVVLEAYRRLHEEGNGRDITDRTRVRTIVEELWRQYHPNGGDLSKDGLKKILYVLMTERDSRPGPRRSA